MFPLLRSTLVNIYILPMPKVKPSLPHEVSQNQMLGHVQPHSACRNSHAAR